jgi:hypothetical protein
MFCALQVDHPVFILPGNQTPFLHIWIEPACTFNLILFYLIRLTRSRELILQGVNFVILPILKQKVELIVNVFTIIRFVSPFWRSVFWRKPSQLSTLDLINYNTGSSNWPHIAFQGWQTALIQKTTLTSATSCLKTWFHRDTKSCMHYRIAKCGLRTIILNLLVTSNY